MTTQPEALRLAEMLTANEWPGHVTLVSYARECVAELRRQHTRITELEAARFAYASEFAPTSDGDQDVSSIHANIRALKTQIEAIGAGGVSQLAQCFDAADMATAAAQGFRDGVASVSAGSEPVANNRPSLEEVFRRLSDRAYCNYIEQIGRDACLGWEHKAAHGKFGEAELKGHTIAGEMLGRHKAFAEAANALRGSDAPLTYPSPPEGMVGGWMPIETAPKNGTEILGYTEEVGALVLYWDSMTGVDHWSDGISASFWKLTHWMHLPAAPGPADGESNG